jgi:hypothetical protein
MPVTVTGFQPSGFQNSGFQIAGAISPPVTPSFNPGDLSKLDLGVEWQSTLVNLGPSLGWQQTYIAPSKIYLVPPNIILTSKDSVVLVNTASPASVSLPDVVAWVRGVAAQNCPPFARLITIKDLTGGAAINNITVVAAQGQTIDGSASVKITTNYGILYLYPRPDLVGWFIG